MVQRGTSGILDKNCTPDKYVKQPVSIVDVRSCDVCALEANYLQVALENQRCSDPTW